MNNGTIHLGIVEGNVNRTYQYYGMRCLVFYQGGRYLAVCLDKNLYTEGFSSTTATVRLRVLIKANHTLEKAPAIFWIRYYVLKLKELLCL